MTDLNERLDAALARAQQQARPQDQPRLHAFMRAASVLWQFAPNKLKADDGTAANGHEVEALLADKVVRLRPRPGCYSDGSWSLQDELRHAYLDGCSAGELRALRARNAHVEGPEQTIVDRWFAGADAALPTYKTEELSVVSRVRDWFTTPPGHFPTTAELEKLRAGARFRAPLDSLTGQHFSGRTSELDRIRAFVFAEPAHRPALLVFHGVGGVGKSTLAAKFLLETQGMGDTSHVGAYLDFDEPKLDISDGVTLVLELARQSAAQLPNVRALREVIDRAVQATEDLSVGDGRAPGRALATKAATQELAEDLGDALRGAGVVRVIIVLDTFEEIQYANADHLTFLQEQLATFDGCLPSLRTLLVSRARIDIAGAEHLPVDELDEDSSRAYLAAREITNLDQVKAALGLARGNPLSLKLAADLLAKYGAEGLNGLDVEAILQQELVQGQLYRRILRHIHQREIQQLAHPGLVVRRVIPEIIQDVLAVPCGLGSVDAARAAELFSHLAREVSLVRVANDGALEHRPDVRRVMLRLLYRDRPQLARDIHQRAAAFYAQRTDEIAIAEEAYHRFALGETSGPWLVRLGGSPAAARLRGALEELPESSWPLIASYAGIDLPAERWDAANSVHAERRLATRIEELLSHDHAEEAIGAISGGSGDLAHAIALLANNPPRSPNSVLWRWQGRAFAQIGRPREALDALEKSLQSLIGPEDELDHDRAVALQMAHKLGDEKAIERLEAMETAFSLPLAQIQLRPDERVVKDKIRIAWLDDQELRLLVKESLNAPIKTFKIDLARRPSTFASNLYAQVVTLNVTPEQPDGTVPLLDFAKRVPKLSATSVMSLKNSLKGFIK